MSDRSFLSVSMATAVRQELNPCLTYRGSRLLPEQAGGMTLSFLFDNSRPTYTLAKHHY
jgi:hypothetical protein